MHRKGFLHQTLKMWFGTDVRNNVVQFLLFYMQVNNYQETAQTTDQSEPQNWETKSWWPSWLSTNTHQLAKLNLSVKCSVNLLPFLDTADQRASWQEENQQVHFSEYFQRWTGAEPTSDGLCLLSVLALLTVKKTLKYKCTHSFKIVWLGKYFAMFFSWETSIPLWSIKASYAVFI